MGTSIRSRPPSTSPLPSGAARSSPVGLADLYLARIDEHDGRRNAFCHRCRRRGARPPPVAADAVVGGRRRRDLRRSTASPLPIKDLTDVAGWPIHRRLRVEPARGRRPPRTRLVERFVDVGFGSGDHDPQIGTIVHRERRGRSRTAPEHRGSRGQRPAPRRAVGHGPIAHGTSGGSIRARRRLVGLPGRAAPSARPRRLDATSPAGDDLASGLARSTPRVLDATTPICATWWPRWRGQRPTQRPAGRRRRDCASAANTARSRWSGSAHRPRSPDSRTCRDHGARPAASPHDQPVGPSNAAAPAARRRPRCRRAPDAIERASG